MLRRSFVSISALISLILLESSFTPTLAKPVRDPDETVGCEILIVGGGLAGVATAYESLMAGRTVCMTEITDWIGGQVSAQGTSALDEADKQRSLSYYPNGYQELRSNIQRYYGRANPGDCWVSDTCFIPADGYRLLAMKLEKAAKAGRGTLKWFPSTVIKELEMSEDGKIIEGAIAIQHKSATNAPLNSEPLSKTIEDTYRYEDSPRLIKKIIRFEALNERESEGADWYVVEATETGEIVALADVPYRLGLDPRSYLNPSSPTESGDPYCTQGFTYTFAMEQTATPQPQQMPSFYRQYEPYYGYDSDRDKALFEYVFTYRRIWSPQKGKPMRIDGLWIDRPNPGDISMQNWIWGNDYRPGTAKDNLIYTREQLKATGQLAAGGWMGGLRTDALRKAEELSLGFYYWLVAGRTDSQLGYGVKQPHPNHRLLSGLNSPMGTAHGLSKYPYIREARRIIGRPSVGYEEGFSINEIDISAKDYWGSEYRNNLPASMYRNLWKAITHLESLTHPTRSPYQFTKRTRSTVYPDALGVAHYAIDFHPCMTFSPPEAPGNREREGVRQAHGRSYPAQIPLRAMIPQKIDNLLVAGKSIAASNIAAAAYRVHSFEWSVGAAAGTTAAFALEKGIYPYQLVDELPGIEPQLQELRRRLQGNGNPTEFPTTPLPSQDWQESKR
ncbi:FAD-binding protein [Hydrococcus rivularis NIES-593]|uniref:FAD-binding protein n=1 Tax=Hydrococcus rivularis NIES-593 TaxID=1921803 RepID=A0A1U7HG72_9CYAN|nr:FAD-dependent oxidoreductase [Hydrococcus rivularis]OKH22576.1 FAD-binding protein [Hydrococcus rivularis NIES-593]